MKIFESLRRRLFEASFTTSEYAYTPREVILERITSRKERGNKFCVFMDADISREDVKYLNNLGYKVTREIVVGMPTFEIFW